MDLEYSVSVYQDLGSTTKSPSPPPLSQRARGDKILPLPMGEGWGEGVKFWNTQYIKICRGVPLWSPWWVGTSPTPTTKS